MSDFAGLNLLSQLVFYRSYAATKSDGYKEDFQETVDRVMNMHLDKFPQHIDAIVSAFNLVRQGVVVPSMRTMQFAGEAIKRENARTFNCCGVLIDNVEAIGDYCYLLMCGCGVGYSVQRCHISCLPDISRPVEGEVTFMIPDSREGWADSFKILMRNPSIKFNYSQIRPAGAPLSIGGTASGPEPLRKAHELIRSILLKAVGRKLRPIEVMDVLSHIADSVVVGGSRRTATLCMFDADDEEMLKAKSGNWYETNGQRARANISAVLMRNDRNLLAKYFRIMQASFESKAGEPGLIFSNDNNYLVNPCAEISLKAVCNLTEINAAACLTREKFIQAVRAATFIGKLQSTYTDFHYLQPRFKQWADEEMLLGVSITGQAEAWNLIGDANFLQISAQEALSVDAEWARTLDIGLAKRIGCTKPSGTTSLLLSTTSGIHAAHAPFYLRRVRVDRIDPVAKYLIKKFGCNPAESGCVIEEDAFAPNNIVVTIPVEKTGAIIRTNETAIDLLNRMKHIYTNWILPTHREGPNTHNVSLTVNYKDEEIGDITAWMYENRDFYTGISLLPYSDSVYKQMPFEEIDMETYLKWSKKFDNKKIDLASVNYSGIADKRQGELACSNGACTVNFL